ncbi:MFS transporter [Oceaniglobus ichthyenteri]|uniref:MFS transporter n=1 Tax=Oceaniglobus ichthyenteri TaxID=2136177 RepID=UPI000D3B9CD4|nr:MFS transporter [Oceaniglobus ichthyenteri]
MSFVTFLRENWLFLTAGILLSFTSSYGQTFFISLFAGEIMGDYGLSHGQWGLIYTVATTASAVAMIWAGVLTDRFRIRGLAVFVCLALAATCLAMAAGAGVWMLILLVFALRFTGQGMMSHLSIVAMARWFVAARGRALSVAAMGFALGQAVLPIIFVALLDVMNWRWLWVIAAALVLCTLPIILRLLRAERTPQSVAESSNAVGMTARHWTRRDVLHHWLFWAMIPLLLGPPAWGTAMFFHQVHLTEVKGWALIDFAALLPLFTVTSIATTFTTGALIDRFGTARLMQLYMIPFMVAFFVMAQAETLWGGAIAMMIFGLGTGAQATIPAAFWAEFYGTRHIGAIKALAAAIMVFGSAIGPGITSVFVDFDIVFPVQMFAISAYFAITAVLSTIAIAKARRSLPVAPKIDVISA